MYVYSLIWVPPQWHLTKYATPPPPPRHKQTQKLDYFIYKHQEYNMPYLKWFMCILGHFRNKLLYRLQWLESEDCTA